MSEDKTEEGAWRRALGYLARQAQTASQIKRYLERRGVAPEVADRVVRRLEEKGFVDDAAYARRWLERRVKTGRTSIRQAVWELKCRGVAPDVIEEVLAELPDNEEEKAANRMVRAHRQRYCDLPLNTWRLKAYRTLLRKGFRPETAFRVVMAWEDDGGGTGG
jgi:regulatory protein